MTVKDQIIQRIEEIDDEQFLTSVLGVLNSNQKKNPYQLTDDQLSMVNEGLADLEEGRTHTHKEANHLTNEWLKNK